MKIKSCKSLFICVLFPLSLAIAGDRFDELKNELSSAECAHFDFMSISESAVFESVDSLAGSAWIARDGRYLVNLGRDKYLFNGELLYSYSSENMQVIIEKIDPAQKTNSAGVSFIIHLGEYYSSKAIQANSEYILYRLDSANTKIPDSLQLFLDTTNGHLERLVYYDLNEDRQQIIMTSRELVSECKQEFFEINWPKGTERVKLY